MWSGACGLGQSGPCMHANSSGQGQRRGEISDRLQRFPEAQDLHPTPKNHQVTAGRESLERLIVMDQNRQINTEEILTQL